MNHILLVDDDKYMNKSLSYILRYEGYSVDAASNAGDALKRLKHNLYDLVVLDYKLTRGESVTGLSLFEKIKELKPAIKAIMISAYGERAVREKARKMGIKYFLDKPFRVGVLTNKIKALLQNKKSGESLPIQ